MQTSRHHLLVFLMVLAVTLATATGSSAGPASQVPPDTIELAQTGGTERPELEPRYEPVAPPERGSFNWQYIFGMTRGVADSTIHPAVKAPLFFLTLPLDLVFLPFATIGGFFG